MPRHATSAAAARRDYVGYLQLNKPFQTFFFCVFSSKRRLTKNYFYLAVYINLRVYTTFRREKTARTSCIAHGTLDCHTSSRPHPSPCLLPPPSPCRRCCCWRSTTPFRWCQDPPTRRPRPRLCRWSRSWRLRRLGRLPSGPR